MLVNPQALNLQFALLGDVIYANKMLKGLNENKYIVDGDDILYLTSKYPCHICILP